MNQSNKSKKQSSTTSDLKDFSFSSIIQQGAESEKENPSSSNVGIKESPTSLPARLRDNSWLSKLKRKEVSSPMTSLPSSKMSSLIKESPSSHTLWTMWCRRLKVLPKAIFLWGISNIAKTLLKWRNKTPKVLIHPDPRLKRIAKPVDFNEVNLEKRTAIVRKMGATLASQTYGMRLGLAAPQIGISLRVMIVRGNVMFNPEWTPSKAPTETSTEACYSVPKKMFKVERAPYGWAKWTNIDGRPMEDKLKGLPAIIFQHEYEHLQGKCCIDTGIETT